MGRWESDGEEQDVRVTVMLMHGSRGVHIWPGIVNTESRTLYTKKISTKSHLDIAFPAKLPVFENTAVIYAAIMVLKGTATVPYML